MLKPYEKLIMCLIRQCVLVFFPRNHRIGGYNYAIYIIYLSETNVYNFIHDMLIYIKKDFTTFVYNIISNNIHCIDVIWCVSTCSMYLVKATYGTRQKTPTNVIRMGAIATKNSLALEYRTMLEVVVEEERV